MLGVTVEKGTIIEWFKSEGDPVKKGESLYVVEADKVTTEVESPSDGILGLILVPAGIEVPVLTVVGVIVAQGEAVPDNYQALAAAGRQKPPAPAPAGPEADGELLAVDAYSAATPQVDGGDYDYDIAVIGGGPGGYVAAIRAAQMGARVILAEKDKLGGTCLNRGCIPTKSLLADVEPLHRIRLAEVYSGATKLAANLAKMLKRKDQVVAAMTSGVEGLLKAKQVRVVKAEAQLLDAHTLELKGQDARERVTAAHVIIATGSRPSRLPDIPLDGEEVITSDEALELSKAPAKLVIIGGGVIGVELATIFALLGSKVTIVEFLPEIVASEDPEVIAVLKASLEDMGVEIITGAKAREVKKGSRGLSLVVSDAGGGQRTIGASKILLAVGRSPNSESWGREALGLRMEGAFIKVDRGMRTSAPGVYAIGDVVGKSMLAHTASEEGVVAVENIMGSPRQINYQRIPNCIYTFPEVASVGLTEAQAASQGLAVAVGKFPYRFNGKASAMGREQGFVKIVSDRDLGEILGVSIVGDHATDLIGEVLLAMNLEADVEDLGEVVNGHPTLSEMIKEAALDCRGLAIHKP
jgi:dihydrolipoamide dehydrogenase